MRKFSTCFKKHFIFGQHVCMYSLYMEAFGTRFIVVSHVKTGNPNEVLLKRSQCSHQLRQFSNPIPTCLNIHRVWYLLFCDIYRISGHSKLTIDLFWLTVQRQNTFGQGSYSGRSLKQLVQWQTSQEQRTMNGHSQPSFFFTCSLIPGPWSRATNI